MYVCIVSVCRMLEQAEMRRLEEQLRMLRTAHDAERRRALRAHAAVSPMHLYLSLNVKSVRLIDLVLKDQQSVGKKSLHLMDTVNAKKRWTTIYFCVNKFLKESHIVTRHRKERASFLKINDIIDISFFETPHCHHCCSIVKREC
jgi:hypothetical protein